MNYKYADGGDRAINDSCYYCSRLGLPYFALWLEIRTLGYQLSNFIFQNLKDYKQVLKNSYFVNR